MSIVATEVYNDIKANPEKWKPLERGCSGLMKDNIELSCCGNTRVLSVIHLTVDEKIFPTSYIDKWKLESIVSWWYKNCSLKNVSEV